ncbi:MAG: tRNA (adenosine(37)-N6)-threonylcarbamoyltransferase complex ATPase subunit type 1 TsaE [Candidatus Paceibacterota bacterium]|jgi:tRNA threonylcarbamoyladenosine biosynthesis protein TsaE|nr:tRNA (adenosine(37)-N6)-threonylcarbamoyltransferase complex ATPase subunit type 1 TsaE [Candidatus Paceibacterota bacterium]
MPQKYVSKSLEDTKQIAEAFVEKLLKTRGKTGGKAVVILLEGNLGSGKTTFVKAVAEILGIKKNITSPTFVLEKVYKIAKNEKFSQMVHIDAYRLSGAKDLDLLGWGEVVENPKNLVFVEWPEIVDGVFPENTPKICFEFVDENTRNLTFSL